jgi:aspartate aminotransferase
MKIASRLRGVSPSATLALAEKAKELAAAGVDVVNLTAGEPDFPLPAHIAEAMHKAVADGETRYTAVPGIVPLREAIRNRYAARGLKYELSEILVSTGAKQSIYSAALALLDPGDEAIVVAPFWLSYADIIRIADAVPVIVETQEAEGFVMSAAALEQAITPRTRMLILNSPSNPAGAVYDKKALEALAEVLRRHPEITIVSDEIYERFVYDGATNVGFLEAAPDLKDRTLIVSGCSKTYAMTGLRIGWTLGPKPIISAMLKVQGQSTSSAVAPTQWAAKAALEGDQSPVDRMVEAFDIRRRAVIGRLHALPNVTCFDPRGAFYVLPNFSAYVGRRLPDGSTIDDAYALSAHLLHDHALVVVPGGPFGAKNHLRLSFSYDLGTLNRGIDRLAAALSGLR